jgi:hypothetical protein
MNIQRFNNTNRMVWQTNGTSQYQLACTSDVLDDQWHHIVGTYDGAEKRIYVDGVLEDSAPCTGAIDTTNSPVEIGRNSHHNSYYWQGAIDDVRIYGRAIAPSEVQALYDMGGGGGGTDPDQDGLPSSWELQYGLDPHNPDSDGDGIRDPDEDPDGDGMTNLQEYQNNTDPTVDEGGSGGGGSDSDSGVSCAPSASDAPRAVTIVMLAAWILCALRRRAVAPSPRRGGRPSR